MKIQQLLNDHLIWDLNSKTAGDLNPVDPNEFWNKPYYYPMTRRNATHNAMASITQYNRDALGAIARYYDMQLDWEESSYGTDDKVSVLILHYKGSRCDLVIKTVKNLEDGSLVKAFALFLPETFRVHKTVFKALELIADQEINGQVVDPRDVREWLKAHDKG